MNPMALRAGEFHQPTGGGTAVVPHTHPNFIKFRIKENGITFPLNIDPFDWGDITLSFQTLEDYVTYVRAAPFVSLVILNMRKTALKDYLLSLNICQDLEVLLELVLEVYQERLPNALFEGLGYSPFRKNLKADAVGASPLLEDDRDRRPVVKRYNTCSLIRPMYWVHGRNEEDFYKSLRVLLPQAEENRVILWTREMVSEKNSEPLSAEERSSSRSLLDLFEENYDEDDNFIEPEGTLASFYSDSVEMNQHRRTPMFYALRQPELSDPSESFEEAQTKCVLLFDALSREESNGPSPRPKGVRPRESPDGYIPQEFQDVHHLEAVIHKCMTWLAKLDTS